jgi:hypothetical protein
LDNYKKLKSHYTHATQHTHQADKRAREAWELEKRGLPIERKDNDDTEYLKEVDNVSTFIDTMYDRYIFADPEARIVNPVVTDMLNHMYDIGQYNFSNTEDKQPFIIRFTRD